MGAKKSEWVWVVVLVESGIPVLVEVYRDEETARIREQQLSEDIRPDYDQAGIFQVEIDATQP